VEDLVYVTNFFGN